MKNVLRLVDYRDIAQCHVVDLDENTVRTSANSDGGNAFRGAVGQAATVTTDLLVTHRRLFALFVREEAIHVYADGDIVRLDASAVRVARTSPFPFLRRFTVESPSTGYSRSWYYWPKDLIEDEPYISDFFWQINRIANDPKARSDFLQFWSKAAAGLDPSESPS